MSFDIHVIGGGLAGSDAAWQLAEAGFRVRLSEMRGGADTTPAHETDRLAEMVVQDLSYTRMADSLNQGGFHTRSGQPWTPLAVFKLTPRLIEVAPQILSGAEWEDRKRQLTRVAWNS